MATRVLQKVQGALESTAGTFATATRKLYATDITHERTVLLSDQTTWTELTTNPVQCTKALRPMRSASRDHSHLINRCSG